MVKSHKEARPTCKYCHREHSADKCRFHKYGHKEKGYKPFKDTHVGYTKRKIKKTKKKKRIKRRK